MVVPLAGCSMTPKMTVSHQVPSSLADDAIYPELVGHYGRPLPTDVVSLRHECVLRGHDVIVLVTSIKNNNAEMDAIRQLNN